MRLTYLFITMICCLVRSAVFSQDSLICHSSSAIVANAKLNVIYETIENPLVFSYEGQNKFILQIDNGKIIEREGFYYVQDAKRGRCNITLCSLKGHKEHRFQFRVKKLPNPIVAIGGTIRGGEVSKNLLLASDHLIPILENFDFELFYKVLSFKVLITNNNNELSNLSITGNSFSEDLKSCISNLQKGESVLFYAIKAKLVSFSHIDTEELDISSVSLTIK